MHALSEHKKAIYAFSQIVATTEMLGPSQKSSSFKRKLFVVGSFVEPHVTPILLHLVPCGVPHIPSIPHSSASLHFPPPHPRGCCSTNSTKAPGLLNRCQCFNWSCWPQQGLFVQQRPPKQPLPLQELQAAPSTLTMMATADWASLSVSQSSSLIDCFVGGGSWGTASYWPLDGQPAFVTTLLCFGQNATDFVALQREHV